MPRACISDVAARLLNLEEAVSFDGEVQRVSCLLQVSFDKESLSRNCAWAVTDLKSCRDLLPLGRGRSGRLQYFIHEVLKI